jgi:hypothetical protein
MSRKPQGVPEFERLLKPLAQVPKAELDRKAAEYEARKKAKLRKK